MMLGKRLSFLEKDWPRKTVYVWKEEGESNADALRRHTKGEKDMTNVKVMFVHWRM